MRLVAGLLLVLASAAGAQPLAPATKRAWDHYRTETRKRIAAEAPSHDGFLASAFLPAAARASFEARLGKGEAPVIVRETRDASGKDIDVPDGFVHHRLGAVLLPGASLDAVLQFAQNYDGHAKVFKDVEASRLLKREGEAFDIELLVRVTKPEATRYLTRHHVVYQRVSPTRAESDSVATFIQELESSGLQPRSANHQSGVLREMVSYWRFEQRPLGVVVECESVSLSRGIPWVLDLVLRSYIQSFATDSLRRTLVNLRDGFARSHPAS